MELHKDKMLPSGLFCVRVIVRIVIDEEIIEPIEDGTDDEPIQGFHRSYGVTARSLADAIQLVEESLLSHQPSGGSSEDPLGSIEMMESESCHDDAANSRTVVL